MLAAVDIHVVRSQYKHQLEGTKDHFLQRGELGGIRVGRRRYNHPVEGTWEDTLVYRGEGW